MSSIKMFYFSKINNKKYRDQFNYQPPAIIQTNMAGGSTEAKNWQGWGLPRQQGMKQGQRVHNKNQQWDWKSTTIQDCKETHHLREWTAARVLSTCQGEEMKIKIKQYTKNPDGEENI